MADVGEARWADVWPLADLRLTITDPENVEVALRPATDDDLLRLAMTLPADIELDPARPTFAVGTVERVRGLAFLQSVWHARGDWSTEHWRLGFAVEHGGTLVGFQELEGTDFARLRTVDTSSFLMPSARGRGVGRAMRAAVLALAFDHLGAAAAITSAWQDNHASLGVSRSLGYEPNGEHRQARSGHPGGVDVMVHLRLTEQSWYARSRPVVRVGGFDRARTMFGTG